VAAEIDRLRPLGRSVRWVPPDNLHLTLKFLGEFSPDELALVRAGLDEAVAGAAPFTLVLHGLGAYPGLARPRVFWVGVAEGAKETQALQSRVETALAERGFEREARPYTPHLTIGRVGNPRGLEPLRTAIVKDAHRRFGALPVSALTLMRSDLSPAGARYTELCTVSFSGH
jgi:2'-5' RNA ligase